MKKTLCSFLVLWCLVISCTNENYFDTSREEVQSTNNSIQFSSFKMSKQVAQNILLSFIENQSPSLTRGGNSVEIEDVECLNYVMNTSVTTRASVKSDTVTVYKFKIKSNESEGYGLVPGDIRTPKVLAYCPKGDLNDTVYNKGLAMIMRNIPNVLQKSIDEFEKAKSSLGFIQTRAFNFFGDNVDVNQDDINIITDITHRWLGDTLCIDTTSVSFWKQELRDYRVPVRWGQGAPYNNKVPYVCGNSKAPAGCVAVAIAQIMAYWKYPSSYNWSILTSSPTISAYSLEDEQRRSEVSKLIADIGSKVHMQYGCNGSGSNIVYANEALQNYGYNTSYYSDFSYDQLTNYIVKNGPTYIRGIDSQTGEGHAWVADALYAATGLVTFNHHCYLNGKDVHSDVFAFPLSWFDYCRFVHLNWGWDGYSNGWFEYQLSNDDSKNTYKNDMKVIFNIKPR